MRSSCPTPAAPALSARPGRSPQRHRAGRFNINNSSAPNPALDTWTSSASALAVMGLTAGAGLTSTYSGSTNLPPAVGEFAGHSGVMGVSMPGDHAGFAVSGPHYSDFGCGGYFVSDHGIGIRGMCRPQA